MEPCVPPGFRFHPTDEELVGYYLKKKVTSQRFELDVIQDVDLYRIEPWDLQERCRIGYEEQNDWYFFSHKDKKYPTGTRTNRATMAGFWKATGRDKAVYEKGRLIGMRKTLVFYHGRAPNGHKTDWIMHEYRLENDAHAPSQEEGWVVCRAFKKRSSRNVKAGCFYDESFDHFKSLSCLNVTSFVQLPEPFMRRSGSLATMSEIRFANEEDEVELANDGLFIPERTDWRTLDKFVASQLSHEDRASSSSFGNAEADNPDTLSFISHDYE